MPSPRWMRPIRQRHRLAVEPLEDRTVPAFVELSKLLPTADLADTDHASGQMGYAVAIDADTAVVGVPRDDAAAPGGGSAYVFVLSGATWVFQAKLTAADADDDDRFGFSVGIDGNTIVVGASQDNTAAGSAYVFVRSGTVWSQQQKLVASDAAVGDSFGTAVGIDGDSVVVGASLDDVGAIVDAGSAYIFTRSGTTWTQQQKVTAADAAGGDAFGASVDIGGDTAVVGANLDDAAAGANVGSAYVFVRSGTSWSPQAKLTPADAAAQDRFGGSVGIDGETIVVGASLDDPAAGSAYVFVRSGVSWGLQQKLTPSDPAASDQFGASVAIFGDTVVVGAIGHDSAASNAGAAYAFTRSGAAWSQQQKMTAAGAASGDNFGFAVALWGDRFVGGAWLDDVAGQTDAGSARFFSRSLGVWTGQNSVVADVDDARFDEFGSAVAIDGSTVVVGAPYDDKTGQDAGAAYVYVKSGPTWILQQKLVPADPGALDNFGASVAVSGDTIVVGAPGADATTTADSGAAYAFVRSGTVWTQQQKIVAGDADDFDSFGGSVDIDGETIVIGATAADAGAEVDAGAAYVFVRSGSVWSQQQRLVAGDAADFDSFGVSVAIDGDSVAVGATGDNPTIGVDAGAAYVFARSGVVWSQQEKLTASDRLEGDLFGGSVAISGDSVVVGAAGDDTGATVEHGSAYVFVRSGVDWSQQQKLTSADADSFDYFGWSVDIDGDSVVVAAFLDDPAGGPDAGAAYRFTRSASTWTQQQKLTPADAADNDHFGHAAAISGDRAAIGARLDDNLAGGDAGAAYVFGVLPVPAIASINPFVGPTTGFTITITGTGFDGATGVLFGSTEVVIPANLSETTIVVVAPNNNAIGDVAVRVSGPGGTSTPVAFVPGIDQITYRPTKLTGVVIDDGSSQKSVVRSISLAFDGVIGSASAGAIAITDRNDNPIADLTINVAGVGTSALTLTFADGSAANVGPVTYGSLADGLYRLAVNGSLLVSGGVAVDADANGSAGGTSVHDFHRLFGDYTGNAFVDATDLYPFLVNSIDKGVGDLGYQRAFDYNGNGFVDATDIYPEIVNRIDAGL